MTNTSTLDIEASAAQCLRIAQAGADLVRLTAQGVRHAKALSEIRRLVRQHGSDIPLVADIHFNPDAAFAAAEEVEKVRINPGNFVDPGRTFKQLTYTDEEYAAEIERIRAKLVPFLELCRANGTAIRLGVNHGSLSDRIMSRYGDTPRGMVESVIEFLEICRSVNFMDVVISIKASNVVVMTQTVRMLADEMARRGMDFPLHLGVTEAGDGDDGRIKSAVGIGSLLVDGLGDTIRVSLSEEPEAELPVARMLRDYINTLAKAPALESDAPHTHVYGQRRPSRRIGDFGADATTLVIGHDIAADDVPDGVKTLIAEGPHRINQIRRAFDIMDAGGDDSPAIVELHYPATMSPEEVTIAASVDLGALLLEGYGADGVHLIAESLGDARCSTLALDILQATRRRISKTEYIACPGCGRTLFGLPEVLGRVRQATSHLKGLKIGVMGCIVNGPGEMADADYGYVGAAAGKISLYKGKECIEKNIPADEAVPRLIELIKAGGDWTDPE